MIRLVVVAGASIGLILLVAFVISRLLRTRTRGMSIRMQVFLALALIVGTFAFGLGLMVIDRIESRAVRLAVQAAEDEAKSIAGIMQGDMELNGVSIHEMARRLGQERANGVELQLALLDAHGNVIFPASGKHTAGGPGIVVVEAPLRVGGEHVGSVRVIKPTLVMLRLLEDFAPTVLVISLVLGAAAALAAAWIGRAIAAPIEALSQFGESVSQGERTRVPSAGSAREVTRLVRAIDSMRRQLEGRPFVETFAADLSHELKNPVAAIRASAEVLEESALEEPHEARRFVARIREAAQRIERLLDELLSLARIEARGASDIEVTRLDELARRSREISGRRGEVEFEVAGDTQVRGDPKWLTRALTNLVDNALLHGEPGKLAHVSIVGDGSHVRVSVRNEGAVAQHVRKQLFRRFVSTRVDKGGSGLGLAIVRAVAEAHGGAVELVSGGPPWVEFRLELPAARHTRGPQDIPAVD